MARHPPPAPGLYFRSRNGRRRAIVRGRHGGGRGVSGYIRRIRGFSRDIKLFLLYNLLVNVGFGVFQLIFNLYLYGLALREDYIGAFNAVQTLAMAAAAVTMGTLLNRFGTWRCITAGASLFLVVSFALALAEQPALLLILAAFNGVGLSFLFTATMPFVIEWTKRDQRPDVAALSFSLISLATTVGALVGGLVPGAMARVLPGVGPGSVEAYRWTLVAGTSVAAFGLIPLFSMGPARHGKPREDHAAARDAEDDATRRRTRRDMGTFILIGGLMSLGAGMVMPFYNVYLTTLGASAREVGYVYAAGGLSAALIGLAAPAVARQFGSLRAVVLVRASIIPFYLLLILSPTYALAVAAHLIRQTSISMAWPLDSTFIAEVLPPRARAGVFGQRSAAWNLGFSGASLLGGAIIVRSGYDWTFASLITFTALSASVFWVYFGRHPLVRSGQIPSALPRSQRPSAPGRPASPADAEPVPETANAD